MKKQGPRSVSVALVFLHLVPLTILTLVMMTSLPEFHGL